MGDGAGLRLLAIFSLVAGAGGIGGLLNAVASGPRLDQAPVALLNGRPVMVPGSFGNVLVGAVAAVISFGLYGPLTNLTVVAVGPRTEAQTGAATPGLTVAALVGAVLVGMSGGRWLTSEAEKQYSQATAAVVARIAEAGASPTFAAPEAPRTAPPGGLQALALSIQNESAAASYAKALNLLEQLNR